MEAFALPDFLSLVLLDFHFGFRVRIFLRSIPPLASLLSLLLLLQQVVLLPLKKLPFRSRADFSASQALASRR